MGLSRKSATEGSTNKALNTALVGHDEVGDNHLEENFINHPLSRGHEDAGTTPPQESYSRAEVFGNLTVFLPPPMMNLVENCINAPTEGCALPEGSVPSTASSSPARGIRMLLSLRRDRTSSHPSVKSPLHGAITSDPPSPHEAVFPFTGLGTFVQANTTLDELDEDDNNDNSLIGSSECVGTTTGASFGMLTGPTSSQSTALFRQRYSQVGGGLFDSMETTTTWDFAPLVAVHPPTLCHSPIVVLSDSCFPTNEDQ